MKTKKNKKTKTEKKVWVPSLRKYITISEYKLLIKENGRTASK